MARPAFTGTAVERINIARLDDAESMTRGLRVTIRMKPHPLRTMWLFAGILLSGSLSWVVIGGTLGQEGAAGSMLGALSVLSVAALPILGVAFLAWRVFWTALGRETILVRRHGLSVRQSLGPLAFTRKYAAAQGRPCAGARRTGREPFWELLCIESGRGSVVFCHEDHMVRIARDLDKAEGVYLITAVRILMQTC